MFIVSLACTDATVAIFSATITPTFLFMKVWIWGNVLCVLVNCVQVSERKVVTNTIHTMFDC
jgi:hypothetical protein